MATRGNVAERGGYDYEFTSKVPEDLECPVCNLTLKDPVQIVGCGHRLCSICMESLLRGSSPTCPADSHPLLREKIFPDTGCHRQILDLHLKCSHSGCWWTGELRALEEHHSECLFKVVKCPNLGCTEMLAKRDMKTHETFECPWRKVNCVYCQESVIMNQKQNHFDICREYPVVCTNKCGVKDIPREKLEVHIWDECPATEVQCEYKNLGCEAVFPRSDVKSHSQAKMESHLNLALRGLEATQHQFHELVNLLKEMSEQIERLTSKDKEQSQQKGRLSEKIERLMSKDKLTPFEWKIPNFKAVCTEAFSVVRRLVSEPFYLFARGYKCLLRIEVNLHPWRSFMSPQNDLRVYIKVVPGEFDESLSWPCKEKVRVTLVHRDLPLDNGKNISDLIDFGEEHCSRPQRDNDPHEYRFILQLSKNEFPSYIKDDTIFIRVNRE